MRREGGVVGIGGVGSSFAVDFELRLVTVAQVRTRRAAPNSGEVQRRGM